MHGVEMGPSKENVIAGGIPNSIIRLVKLINPRVNSIIITNDRKYRESHISTDNFSFPFAETHMVLIGGKYASVKYFFEYFFKVVILISKLKEKKEIDIIHGHSGHPALAIVTNFAGIVSRVPTVHTMYCPVNPKDKFNWVYKYLLSNIKIFIAISENVKSSLISIGVPQEKIRIVPPVIDFTTFKPNETRNLVRTELLLKDTDFLILYLGNLTKTKGIDLILDSLNILKLQNVNFKFVSGIELTHTGTNKRKKEIIDKIDKYKLKNHIIELGLIKNVPEIMNACDIVVAPFEDTYDVADYPLTILEAMAVGIPVITTNVGGIPEIIDDQNTGILTKYDKCDLANHIIELINHPDICNQIRKNATIFVKEKFSEDFISKKTYETYRETRYE